MSGFGVSGFDGELHLGIPLLGFLSRVAELYLCPCDEIPESRSSLDPVTLLCLDLALLFRLNPVMPLSVVNEFVELELDISPWSMRL